MRTWCGTDVKDVDGEYDCWRSCLDTGAGVGEANNKDLERLEADMGVANDMSELYDLLKEWCRCEDPLNGDVSGLRSWSSIVPPDNEGYYYIRSCQNREQGVNAQPWWCRSISELGQCTMEKALSHWEMTIVHSMFVFGCPAIKINYAQGIALSRDLPAKPEGGLDAMADRMLREKGVRIDRQSVFRT